MYWIREYNVLDTGIQEYNVLYRIQEYNVLDTGEKCNGYRNTMY